MPYFNDSKKYFDYLSNLNLEVPSAPTAIDVAAAFYLLKGELKIGINNIYNKSSVKNLQMGETNELPFVYKGGIKNKKFSGKGVLAKEMKSKIKLVNGVGSTDEVYYKMNEKFDGNWKNNKFHGNGKYFFSEYGTEWLNKNLDKPIPSEDNKKIVIKGKWRNNLLHGEKISFKYYSYYSVLEEEFVGNFKNGFIDGIGRLIFYNCSLINNKLCYAYGYFKDQRKEGKFEIVDIVEDYELSDLFLEIIKKLNKNKKFQKKIGIKSTDDLIEFISHVYTNNPIIEYYKSKNGEKGELFIKKYVFFKKGLPFGKFNYEAFYLRKDKKKIKIGFGNGEYLNNCYENRHFELL